MLVLRDPALAATLEDEALRALITQRFVEIAQDEPYDPDTFGYFVVVEPGDSVESVEKEVGWPILGSVFNDARFGDPDFRHALSSWRSTSVRPAMSWSTSSAMAVSALTCSYRSCRKWTASYWLSASPTRCPLHLPRNCHREAGYAP